MRRRIRAEGIELLNRLHESMRYDRIVVVGHSLGSVIAYDVLRHLWPRFNTLHGSLAEVDQTAIHNHDAISALLSKDADAHADEFRENQSALWVEQRRIGNPWLVMDLITLGSPLAHAQLLLARTPPELRDREQERELPTCPPIPDERRASYRINYEVNGQKRTIFALHHAALFACVRWTNIYYPAWGGFFGDLVGGPLRGVFGAGINDIAVRSAEAGGWLQHTPVIHTHYWKTETAGPAANKKRPWTIDALREALDLESRRLLREATVAQFT